MVEVSVLTIFCCERVVLRLLPSTSTLVDYMPIPVDLQYLGTPASSTTLCKPTTYSCSNMAKPFPDYTIADFHHNFDTFLLPSFAFHALTIARNRRTKERPSIRKRRDCWVIQPGFLRCLSIGRRLYWDPVYTVVVAYLYASSRTRDSVSKLGMFIVPTRYRWKVRHEEDDLKMGEITDEFQWFCSMIDIDAHQAVQLTFEGGTVPNLAGADEVPGFWRFAEEIHRMRDWEWLG